MSERLTDVVTPPSTVPRRRPSWWVPAVQGVVILALFAGIGCLAGWAWWKIWSPAPSGIAFDGRWYPQPTTEGLAAEFAGTGWYVAVAIAAGVVLGLLSGLLLDRDELVTLVAVAIGSLLAAWLMFRMGMSLSPPDPGPIAKVAEDRMEIPGHLVLAGEMQALGRDFDGQLRSPMLALPTGAMAGLAIALFGVTKPGRSPR